MARKWGEAGRRRLIDRWSGVTWERVLRGAESKLERAFVVALSMGRWRVRPSVGESSGVERHEVD